MFNVIILKNEIFTYLVFLLNLKIEKKSFESISIEFKMLYDSAGKGDFFII